MIITFYTLF